MIGERGEDGHRGDDTVTKVDLGVPGTDLRDADGGSIWVDGPSKPGIIDKVPGAAERAAADAEAAAARPAPEMIEDPANMDWARPIADDDPRGDRGPEFREPTAAERTAHQAKVEEVAAAQRAAGVVSDRTAGYPRRYGAAPWSVGGPTDYPSAGDRAAIGDARRRRERAERDAQEQVAAAAHQQIVGEHAAGMDATLTAQQEGRRQARRAHRNPLVRGGQKIVDAARKLGNRG